MEPILPVKVEIASLIKKIVPVLSPNSLKGDNGTVGTIGGSLEYTGAPYYSAITSLKSGCDLSHVFCHTEATIPIKCYSPELIVHPGFSSILNNSLLDKTIRWFKSMNSIAMGPGLGRDEDIKDVFVKFSNSIFKLNNTPLVYDADALWFLGKTFSQLENINNLIITPNKTEFDRLYAQLYGKDENQQNGTLFSQLPDDDILLYNTIPNTLFIKETKLCKSLGNTIVVKKGPNDIITNGKKVYIIKNAGSMKRTGGIGDILTGLINCYCGMMKRKHIINNTFFSQDDLMDCCVLGCYMCRVASRSAFEKHKYSLTAPDIINELNVITNMYDKLL